MTLLPSYTMFRIRRKAGAKVEGDAPNIEVALARESRSTNTRNHSLQIGTATNSQTPSRPVFSRIPSPHSFHGDQAGLAILTTTMANFLENVDAISR